MNNKTHAIYILLNLSFDILIKFIYTFYIYYIIIVYIIIEYLFINKYVYTRLES